MIDYMKQMEHLGADMTPQEKQDAMMNGIHNNIAFLFSLVDQLQQRVIVLEEKQNA